VIKLYINEKTLGRGTGGEMCFDQSEECSVTGIESSNKKYLAIEKELLFGDMLGKD
jgi:hypothetical protein